MITEGQLNVSSKGEQLGPPDRETVFVERSSQRFALQAKHHGKFLKKFATIHTGYLQTTVASADVTCLRQVQFLIDQNSQRSYMTYQIAKDGK